MSNPTFGNRSARIREGRNPDAMKGRAPIQSKAQGALGLGPDDDPMTPYVGGSRDKESTPATVRRCRNR
jgi:hypothetical protein